MGDFTLTDQIEDITVEVDGGYGEDGRQTRGFLVLEGDFVKTFEDYLALEDCTSIILRLPEGLALSLRDQLNELLG